jgi:hypothetical protein
MQVDDWRARDDLQTYQPFSAYGDPNCWLQTLCVWINRNG